MAFLWTQPLPVVQEQSFLDSVVTTVTDLLFTEHSTVAVTTSIVSLLLLVTAVIYNTGYRRSHYYCDLMAFAVGLALLIFGEEYCNRYSTAATLGLPAVRSVSVLACLEVTLAVADVVWRVSNTTVDCAFWSLDMVGRQLAMAYAKIIE